MADTRMIQRGRASLTTLAGNIDAYASVNLRSLRGQHEWKSEELGDFNDFDVAWFARNEHITIEIMIQVTGASKALAKTNGAFLTPLSAVTLSGFDLEWLNTTGVNGKFTGSWQYYKGGNLDLSADRVGGMGIPLRKYADPTQNTLSTTEPS